MLIHGRQDGGGAAIHAFEYAHQRSAAPARPMRLPPELVRSHIVRPWPSSPPRTFTPRDARPPRSTLPLPRPPAPHRADQVCLDARLLRSPSPGGDDFGDDWIKIIARGDTAYDSRNIFDKCHDLGIDPCIRIRRNANLQSRGKGDARPKAVIDQLGGGNPDPDTFYALIKGARHMYQKAWKVIAQYGRRWLHETDFGSFKVLMGGSIMAVKPSNMVTEVALKIGLYNRLQAVGAEAAAAAANA